MRMGGKPRKYRKPGLVLGLHVPTFSGVVKSMAALATRVDHVPGALAMFTLFDLKKWERIPHESVLKKDNEVQAVMEEVFSPINSRGRNSGASLFDGELTT
jgi:hypothetical protein